MEVLALQSCNKSTFSDVDGLTLSNVFHDDDDCSTAERKSGHPSPYALDVMDLSDCRFGFRSSTQIQIDPHKAGQAGDGGDVEKSDDGDLILTNVKTGDEV